MDGSTILANEVITPGGRIYNKGTITIVRSRILKNIAHSDGGGVYNHASAVRATITGTCISGNSATSFLSDHSAKQTITGNWWGAVTGRNTPGADTVSGNVDTSGFLVEPILGCHLYTYLPFVLMNAP